VERLPRKLRPGWRFPVRSLQHRRRHVRAGGAALRDLDPVSAAYVQTITAMPAIQQWVADARAETEVIPQFEPYA